MMKIETSPGFEYFPINHCRNCLLFFLLIQALQSRQMKQNDTYLLQIIKFQFHLTPSVHTCAQSLFSSLAHTCALYFSFSPLFFFSPFCLPLSLPVVKFISIPDRNTKARQILVMKKAPIKKNH